jgi:phosphatidate cytidylyltransferase
MPLAIGVGLALAALFLILLAAGPKFAVGLVVVVLVAAAIEFFDGLRRVGYQPATLLGLAAVAGLPLAGYWRYESGVLLVLALALVGTLAWYVLADQDVKAVPNIAVTFLGIGYVGFLGSFAALMLAIPEAGTGILLGVGICTVAYDVGGLFVGSGLGRSPIAPDISPNKTIEGLIGGGLAAILAGIVLSQTLSPWDGELLHGLQLGIIVALAAPLGDLVESRMKRDLGLKDFGSLLPGHGGVLDRFDAFLFTLPSAYYLVRILNLYG